jgi:ATP:ADP antiporter, AAA family
MSHPSVDAFGERRLFRVERCVGLLTTLRPGEGKSVLLFFCHAFVLLLCYYVLKTLREPLLLQTGSAELKSYAYAVIACILLPAVPLYSMLFRRVDQRRLVRCIGAFFVSNLAVFYCLGRAGVDIGFAYYVWVGVFSVSMLAQFWAHAAHSYSSESGQRLFPIIMGGAALGAVAGPRLSSALFEALGPWNTMLAAAALLASTLPLVERTWRSVPHVSRRRQEPARATTTHPLGGLALVVRDRYLLLLAGLAVLLNCVNSTGEYILAELVLREADRQISAFPDLDRGTLIAQFYGNYLFAVNVISIAIQVCLVARLFRWIGVPGAVLVLPVIALIGYGLIFFLPVFAIVRAVKIIENGVEYSIMNTARQALYLPLATAHQYEGKTAIDTFFWRFGDVLQAGVVYAGLNWLGFGFQQFALLNMALSVVWIFVAVQICKHRRVVPSAVPGAPAVAIARVAAVALPAVSTAKERYHESECRRWVGSAMPLQETRG